MQGWFESSGIKKTRKLQPRRCVVCQWFKQRGRQQQYRSQDRELSSLLSRSNTAVTSSLARRLKQMLLHLLEWRSFGLMYGISRRGLRFYPARTV